VSNSRRILGPTWQSAIDRFTSNAYDLVIEGESYRPRLKPRVPRDRPEAAQ